MNSAIELHDSEVRSVSLSGSELRIALEPAYVHRSVGRPGVDAGFGYLQPAELVFTEARYSENGGACTGTVSDGFIGTDQVKYSNVIPLPLALSGIVSAEITFTSGAVLKIGGRGVSCVVTGDADPDFAEPYEG